LDRTSIPLKTASVTYYDAEYDFNRVDITRMVADGFRTEGSSSLEESILIDIGLRLIRHYLDVPIYGRLLPGNKSKKIPTEIRKHAEDLSFSDSVATFKSYLPQGEGCCKFYDIKIKKFHLAQIIKKIRNNGKKREET
jgi:hypothetical protein